MIQAIWNGQVIAESERTVMMEGNHYFPLDSVKQEFLKSSNQASVCPWKGTASYYHIEVSGKRLEDAVWYYPTPSDAAASLKDHVAFWRGVKVR